MIGLIALDNHKNGEFNPKNAFYSNLRMLSTQPFGSGVYTVSSNVNQTCLNHPNVGSAGVNTTPSQAVARPRRVVHEN
jgi:hypothetical protein